MKRSSRMDRWIINLWVWTRRLDDWLFFIVMVLPYFFFFFLTPDIMEKLTCLFCLLIMIAAALIIDGKGKTEVIE